MNGKLRNMTAIYLQKGDKVLLLYRMGSKVVADSYTGTAGGHFEEGELNDARACILRELDEETGMKEENLKNLAMRYVTLRLKNNEIRQNYYFFAEMKEEDEQINATRKIESNEGKLQWVQERDLLKLEMPFTAKEVIRHYLDTGKDSGAVYGGVATEYGVIFTELEEF